MIAVGMMDRQVKYFRAVNSPNISYGGNSSTTWEGIGGDYAHIIWKTGSNTSEEGMQMQDNQVVEFYVRNQETAQRLTVRDYVLYGVKKYWIKSIDDIDGRKKYLRITGTSVEPIANL